MCFGCCFLCFSFSLFGFSPLSLLFPFPFSLFCCFLFSFSFFASSSSLLFFFLGLSFVCFVLSSFFVFSFHPSSPLPLLPLFLILLLFVPILVSSSSLSSGFSFSAFPSLSPALAFPPLPPSSSPLFFSSSFVSVSFPLSSSSLPADYSSFSSVLAASLVVSSSSSLPS